MKVYPIKNNNISHKNVCAKRIIRGHLKDGSTALIEMNVNRCLNIEHFEMFKLKKGKVIDRIEFDKQKASNEDFIMSFFEKLQEMADEDVSFIGEFTKAMLGK